MSIDPIKDLERSAGMSAALGGFIRTATMPSTAMGRHGLTIHYQAL